MVSGEAFEIDDEDDDDVDYKKENEKCDDDLEIDGKYLKEEVDGELQEFEFDVSVGVKIKRQKIVYKFDS